ncbi:Sulfotransfer-1 domain-containing protein [Aphelenchoides bicaudatus]|nr:Sulfotransfer-1 domain-containing protein [Aphelenchoides bicaudatus]
MTAEATAKPSIRMRRRISVAAVSVRRNSNKFWTDALNDIAMGHLTINGFSRPLTFCEEMVKSPITPHVLRDALIYQPSGQPKQAMIDGEVWPPIFQAEKVRSAKQIKPRTSDVFVCTYPKCGTTWVQQICSQLLFNDYEPQEGQVPELSKQSPMIEKVGAECVEELKHPRLLKTHFSYYNCPKSSEAKYIFVARNPKDCLTSYYFHCRNFKIYDWATGDFDVFFELFASGQLGFGDYFDHLLGWLPHVDDKNVLFLTYEDMFDDLSDAIQKIGHFLGGHASEIVDNPRLLAKVVKESHIDSMKKNQGRWFPSAHLNRDFIRKGGSRDWKNYMNKEQSDRLDAIWRTRMAGSIAEQWWQYEMAWDEDLSVMPEIVLPVEDETESEAEEPYMSSRRSSVYTLTPYMPNRRNSMESVASSGYGSVWSLATGKRRRRSPESQQNSSDSDE